MATVTSRIVAEIYKGIDFPIGWIDKPNVLNVGMARDTVASIAAMFDATRRPIALCWRIGSGEEKFACVSPGTHGDTSPADELNNELAQESLHFGAEDLLGTLLWDPDELRPDQGQSAHQVVFIRGNAGLAMPRITGWNIPPRVLLAKANDLLMMTRCVDDGLAFPMPTSIEQMHRHMDTSDPSLLTILPGSAVVPADQGVGKKMALLFRGLLAAGTLICAYLLQ